MPESARIEGGDVLLTDEFILIGYSEDEDFEKYKVARTNKEGVTFIKAQFPDRTVVAFELNKSDVEPIGSALHLDCCFQPIGRNGAIICEAGFKNIEDIEILEKMFLKENIIRINADEMYHMNSNLFSISEDVIVSQPNFRVLNEKLRKQGLTVEEVPYSEVSKMGGLFRCSTMPLKRL
jgi:N-dimethylarginine dimethylaminohydrolase